MKKHCTKSQRGFSLLEMVVATAIGSVVLGAALQTYVQGVNATWAVTQRAELQQDFRAASDMITKDLSLAGAGLGNSFALALPSTVAPQYGCDQIPKCYLNGVAGTYPLQGTIPYFYGLMPGYGKGPILVTGQGNTDVITVAYADPTFYLNCYAIKITAKGIITFSQPSGGWPAACMPTGVSAPQAVNDAVAGLTAGDLVLLTFTGNQQILVEVTGAVINTATNTYTVPFANNDSLKMNQTPSSGTGLNSLTLNTAGTSVPFGGCTCRVQVITYYLDNTVTPARLMRQVSGHTPVPVAENIVYMKFSYDLFNDATATPAINCSNPGASTDGCSGASSGLIPNQITKINILNMAIDSSQKTGLFAQNGYQRLDLQTSVSARNLSYVNNY